MKLKTTLVAAAVALLPVASLATPLAPGTYTALDYDGSRSIWTPNGNGNNPPNNNKIVDGGGVSHLWKMVIGQFQFNGSLALFTGTVENLTNNTLSFDFSLNFNNGYTGNILNDGYCQFPTSNSNKKCSPTDVSNIGSSTDTWTYLNFVSGSFTGTGGALTGAKYEITEKSGHPPQAGLEANALSHNDKDGFSMWFHWEKTMDAVDPGGYTFYDEGRGDFNINLEFVNSNTPDIPLPAGGFLLIGALGGLAAFSRRRKAA